MIIIAPPLYLLFTFHPLLVSDVYAMLTKKEMNDDMMITQRERFV